MDNINIDILNDLIIGRVEPQIYAFTTETIPNYLKVGDTYRPLETRLNEWRKYFPNLEKKFENVAKVDDETFFRDYAVHYFLENDLKRSRLKPNTLKEIPYYSNEFFENTTETDLQESIEDIKSRHKNNDPKYQYYRFDESHIPIIHTYQRTENYNPRPNQQETISRFREAIDKGRKNLLMYAVMRFGKSFTSMCCAVEMGAKSVVVVSAKADVKEEWKKTVESHKKFDGYSFFDSNSLLQSDTVITDKQQADEKFVIFLTLQDLQGNEIKTKHKALFENEIDLLLIDETHFGARAEEYGKVLKTENFSAKQIKNELKFNDNSLDDLEITNKVFIAKIRIHLSGTPYRILMDSEFSDDDIIAFYQFPDIAEDQEKWDLENLNKDEIKEWDNPYYGFPQMVRFAFNPNDSSRKKMEELKKNGVTYAFSELFKPQSITKDTKTNLHKKFVHEAEILDLLKVIDGSETDENLLSFLDYDKIKDGKMCRHIVCVLPYRASCDALEELIKNYKFKHLSTFEIINISGVDNERNYKDTQAVQSKIKNCERENIKTLTLTVNRMLTGSTVPEWDTMLYLKDTSSPQEYDQAVFRLQNQYIKVYKEPNGDVVKFNMKPQTLLVDFNPNRMFQMQEQKSQIYNVNTDKNGNSLLAERIKRELEISPIIVLNNKKMVEIQPTDILDAVRKYSNSKSVLDEATTISIDYALLDIEAIKTEIERQNKINSRGGIEIKQKKGDGDDIETPDGGESTGTIEDDTPPKPKNKEEKPENDYKGQFAMYYARILFFAFLTDSRVKALQEIINEIGGDTDNQRIANNLNLDKQILSLFQQHINPFVLSELDYKIQNINTLANDSTISPIERASNAMKKFSRLSDSEVVTPENVTDMMLNALPENAINAKTNILDIASKQGEFVYAVYKKFGKEIANNFYAIPTSKIAYEFTLKVYKLLELDMKLIEENYTSYDLIKENNFIEKDTLTINGKKLKLDVVVGNPPYQDTVEKTESQSQANSRWLYYHFQNIADKIGKKSSLIYPFGGWFDDVRTYQGFGERILSDGHTISINAFEGTTDKRAWYRDDINPKPIFGDSVNLSAGVSIVNRDMTKTLKTFEFSNRIYSDTIREVNIDEWEVLSPNPDFTVGVKLFGDKLKTYVSNKTFGIESDFIENNPNLYSLEPSDFKDPIRLLTNDKSGSAGRAKWYFVERTTIEKNTQLIDQYKVAMPSAYPKKTLVSGVPTIEQVLTRASEIIDVFKPKEVFGRSKMLLFHSPEKIDVDNFIKYTHTRFFAYMVLNEPNRSFTFGFVIPLLDFTSNSDIDWSKTISNIDQQLYKKYKLSQEEIEFIEKMIKPMD